MAPPAGWLRWRQRIGAWQGGQDGAARGGSYPECGGWCLLSGNGRIAEHADAYGTCPGSGRLPASTTLVTAAPHRPPLYRRPAVWGWAALVVALVAVVVIPARQRAADDRAHSQLDAGVAYVCDQYQQAVANGHGPVHLAPPPELAGDGFDVNDPDTARALAKACGDAVEAFRDARPAPAATPSAATGDGSVHDALVAARVAGAPARELAVVARETGYLWKLTSPDEELNEELIEGNAQLMVLECRDVGSGERTWQENYAQAVSTGATPEDARTMTTYLQTTFCPQVR